MYVAFATNEKTGEVVELETFNSAEDAWWEIENNLEWDEEDNPADWTFQVVEREDDEDYEPDYDECGFDPYEGCYTYDC